MNKQPEPLPPDPVPPKPGQDAPPSTAQSTRPLTQPLPSTTREIKAEEKSMEVHHHSHAGHGKKNWKSYFWEFLMLFLAVFCGFLAEYKLEHVIEHQREGQYIESLLEDLKTDQQILSAHMAETERGIKMLDTLTLLLNDGKNVASHSGQLYFLARLAPRQRPLSTSTRTFDQLKNSGNFRLIRKLEASNRIVAYYEKFPQVRLLEGINETEFSDYKRLAAKIFDPLAFVAMEGPGDAIVRGTDNPPLRTTNADLLKELSVFVVYLRGTKKGILRADEDLRAYGKELIEYLERDYGH